MRRKLGLLLLSLAPVFADGTQAVSGWGFGTELQVYPAGLIPGARLEYFLDLMQNVNLRVGYNVARRQDFGRHTDERGAGWGGGIGYRRYGFRERLPFLPESMSTGGNLLSTGNKTADHLRIQAERISAYYSPHSKPDLTGGFPRIGR